MIGRLSKSLNGGNYMFYKVTRTKPFNDLTTNEKDTLVTSL